MNIKGTAVIVFVVLLSSCNSSIDSLKTNSYSVMDETFFEDFPYECLNDETTISMTQRSTIPGFQLETYTIWITNSSPSLLEFPIDKAIVLLQWTGDEWVEIENKTTYMGAQKRYINPDDVSTLAFAFDPDDVTEKIIRIVILGNYMENESENIFYIYQDLEIDQE